MTPYFWKCGVTSDLWGYAIEIDGGVLPMDAENIITVRFTDPSLVKHEIGANHQSVTIRVEP